MSKTSNQNFENNDVDVTRPLGEGSSPDRCFLVQQREPGRHQVTARMKSNMEVNKVVMEYFYRSKPLMKEGNLSQNTDLECLENGEIEDCLNHQSNVFVTSKGN